MRLLLALIGLLVCAPCTVGAQEPGRVYRLGILSPSVGSVQLTQRWTLPVLEREGFIVGRNLIVEARTADDLAERLPAAADELAGTRPDVVIAVSNPAAHALRRAAPGIPIVMGFAGTDPTSDTLAKTLARPGGSVTGLVMLAVELDHKRIELARDILPEVRRIGFLSGNTATEARQTEAASVIRSLGADPVMIRAGGRDSYADAIARFAQAKVDMLVIGSNPGFAREASYLAELSKAARLPTICEWREMAEAGCLIGYGPKNAELRSRVAWYVARILRGVPAGTLPMEQPSTFELVVNQGTARALGLPLSPAVLARADEVIE